MAGYRVNFTFTLTEQNINNQSGNITFHSTTCFLANSCNVTHILKAVGDINKTITEEHFVNTIYNN